MGRSPCCTKEGVRRGAWTPMEDTILTHYISLHGGGNWRNLPQMAGLKRCGKSCRMRWLNYLRPDIKRGNITPDEEELIIRLHRLLGNRWSLIAGRLPGRTDNEIKNYWNSTLNRRLHLHRQHKTKRSIKIKTMINKSSVNTMGDPDPEKKESGRAVRTKAVKCTKVFYSPPPVAGVEDPCGLMGNMPVVDFGGEELGSFSEFFMESLSNEGEEGSPASQLEEPIVFSDEMVEDWRRSSCPLDASVVDYWLGV